MFQSNIVVDHIATFTAQRDQELLAFSLLKSVNSMMSSLSSRILTMDKRGNIVSNMLFEGDNCQLIHHEKDLEKQIVQACERMKDSDVDSSNIQLANKVYLLRLVYHNRKIDQFLVIELDAQVTKVQSYILAGILNIYHNFLELLNDSQTDELTGLANRKTFDSAISKVFDNTKIIDGEVQAELRKQEQVKSRYWLAIIDIDDFKQVNDKYGHLYGDEILIHVAQLIKSSFRYEDMQFRFGGEEFVVLLSADDEQQCLTILERFRTSIEQYDFPDKTPVTLSIGVVEFIREVFHVTSIDYADQALYHSKANGKNQVTFYETMLSKGLVKQAEMNEGDVELF